jgi:hypothetical protein
VRVTGTLNKETEGMEVKMVVGSQTELEGKEVDALSRETVFAIE